VNDSVDWVYYSPGRILVCYAASYASKFEAAEIDQLISNTIVSHVTPHVNSTSCAFSDAVKIDQLIQTIPI